MFADYLSDTMEVYIDDMLVKSLLAEQQLNHRAKPLKYSKSIV